jgi:hypothetical protein
MCVNEAEKSEGHTQRRQEARRYLGSAVAGGHLRCRLRRPTARGPSHEPDARGETYERGPRSPEKSAGETTQDTAEKGERASTADAGATAKTEDLALVAPAQRMVGPSMKGVRVPGQAIDAVREGARDSRVEASQDECAARRRTAVP